MKRSISWTLLVILLFSQAIAFAREEIPYPDARFLVFSDPHFYDTGLGSSGEALQSYLDQDRKLLVLSDEILGTAVAQMADIPADFVLIAGDLTKDGEKICHQGVIRHLKTLGASGKKIFVVPGNHDVSNPASVRYQGKETLAEPSVTPEEFADLYQDFGYGQAIARDPDSLSYLAEPVNGLWLLAIDSNRYEENQPGGHPITGGAISPQSQTWLTTQLTQAQSQGKAVIAVLHHGILEHYPNNKKFYEAYLVEAYKTIAQLLADFGVQLVFTGHFHAQDITQAEFKDATGKNQRIFDIETGSLVTWPCPYRIVDINQNTARITSRVITGIPSMGEAFEPHAYQSVVDGTRKLADTKLAKFRVSQPQRSLVTPQVAAAYTTHLKGDEFLPETIVATERFGLWLNIVAWYQKDLLKGWYTDLPPKDNEIFIDLATGRVNEN